MTMGAMPHASLQHNQLQTGTGLVQQCRVQFSMRAKMLDRHDASLKTIAQASTAIFQAIITGILTVVFVCRAVEQLYGETRALEASGWTFDMKVSQHLSRSGIS